MNVVGVVLAMLGTVAYLWACILYARCSWYTNCDLMGASVAFTSLWMIGTMFVSTGLTLGSVLGFWPTVAASIALLFTGKLFEWFAIEPLLSTLFRSYRKEYVPVGLQFSLSGRRRSCSET